jgi:cell division protein FtsW (lipid II flippase)
LPAQLVFSLLGLGLGAGLTFTDYAVLKRLALPSYLATAAVLLGALIGGPRYQGQPYLFLGGLRIKLIDACPLLFTITLAGLASRARWQSRKAGAGLTLAVGIAEVLLCAGGSLTALILFLVGIAAVLLASHARGWQTAAIGTVGIALSATFWRPDVFVGAGAAAAVRLAEAHTDYVFAALLGTPGRVVAALAACLALFLLGQLAEAIRAIRAETPRLVSVGVTALFAAEVAWSLLANLGWAPMPAAGLGFPFLSFGGTLLVVHAASLGLVLGAYRRKTLQTV